MRRRVDSVPSFDPSSPAPLHNAGERQVIVIRGLLVISPVPDFWRVHARQPWRVVFPELDWPERREGQEGG